MRRFDRMVLLLSMMGLTACAAGPGVDIEAEKAALLELDREWSRLASEGADIEAIVHYWADDAVVVAPGQPPVVGHNALHDMVESSVQIPGWSISWEADDVHVSPDGRMAWMSGTNRVTFQNPDGSTTTAHGRSLTVWEKNDLGEWKCVYDIWNDAPREAAG